VVEAVLAGDELAALDQTEEVEGVAAADGPGLLELGGDGRGGGAGGYVDVDGGVVGCAGGRADGGVDEVAGDGGGEEEQDQERG
jgi:hypothetical protein